MQKYNLINIKTNKIIFSGIKPDLEKILEYTKIEDRKNYKVEIDKNE